MKTNLRTLVLFSILMIFTQSDSNGVAKPGKKNKNERQLFFIESGIYITSLISTYFFYKYWTQKKILTWQDDKNWSKRFFVYYEKNSIPLRYVNLLVDSYASELMNHCISIFKEELEESENALLIGFDSLNICPPGKNFLDLDKNDIKKMTKEEKESYKIFQKKFIDKTSVFEKNVNYCYDFFKYIKDHAFITKYIFEPDSVTLYYSNSKKYFKWEDENEKNDWQLFMDRLQTEFMEKEQFSKFQENHKSYFYTIINFFLKDQNVLNTYMEKKKKISMSNLLL
jgi:hypothetical protein